MSLVVIAGFGGVFAVLAVLFAKNVLRGRRTGKIYSQAVLINRSESPINFWITVALYTAATVFAGAAASFCILYAITAGNLGG